MSCCGQLKNIACTLIIFLSCQAKFGDREMFMKPETLSKDIQRQRKSVRDGGRFYLYNCYNQVKGKRPKEPKSFPEFQELLDTVEGLKVDSEGNMALRHCGRTLLCSIERRTIVAL